MQPQGEDVAMTEQPSRAPAALEGAGTQVRCRLLEDCGAPARGQVFPSSALADCVDMHLGGIDTGHTLA